MLLAGIQLTETREPADATSPSNITFTCSMLSLRYRLIDLKGAVAVEPHSQSTVPTVPGTETQQRFRVRLCGRFAFDTIKVKDCNNSVE